MERLIEGLRQFHGNVFPGRSEQFRTLASEGQSPTTLMISCADSRVVPELITQSEPGDLFVCRNAGNIVPPWQEANGGVSSTIEYAVVALGVTDIVICGHSDCGAMKGLMAPEALTTMPSVQKWLGHAAAAAETVKVCHPDADDEQKLHAMIEENVIAQLVNLRGHPSVAAAMAKGELRLHGWVYDIESGGIRALDGDDSTFKPTIPGHPLPVADFGRQSRDVKQAA